MEIVRFHCTFIVVVLIIVVQLSDGRPVTDKIALPLVEDTTPTSVVLTSVVTHIGHLKAATFLSGLDLSGTVTSAPSSKQSDNETTVAISTVVGIVVFLLLFIVVQSLLCSVACRKVDIFTTMKCGVRHQSLISTPQHIARDRVPRSSLRSASPVSDISDASTLCAIPLKEICQPAPAHVDMSPVHHQ